jgi:hypothetical protein
MTEPTLPGWSDFLDRLKPVGARVMAALPPAMRDDPQTVQECWRLLLSGIIRAASDAIAGDRAHPFFVPELHIGQNIYQPNADTIYKAALIGQGGTYRLKGDRGTARMMILAQLGPDMVRTGIPCAALGSHDFASLTLDADGLFDVVVSPTRPPHWHGDWWQLHPNAEKFMVRIVACRWGEEREPSFGIDRLDTPAAKGRRPAAQIAADIAEIPTMAANAASIFVDHVRQLRDQGHLNSLKIVDFSGMTGLARQSYYEGAYDLADDEALIVEVKIPDHVGYWSLILTNEIFETTDWYNNQSSLNDSQAVLDADGYFRAVISARDPGVPNWLDTSGYPRGAVQGRWFETDERPTPTMRKLNIADIRAALPTNTPTVTPAERETALRTRRISAHRRVIW